jgi:queuine tRNA-ribosyltransferase
MSFQLIKTDTHSSARLGQFQTDHGLINTPAFIPVGTQATVKTLSNAELTASQAQIILGNTYHLFLRPGNDVIEEAGGLHRFMNWKNPILTDSGGYQIFSLASLSKIKDEGVDFQSHLDGSSQTFTPESVIDYQRTLGSDIMMVLDECTPYPCTIHVARKAHVRTGQWAEKSMARFGKTDAHYGHRQYLFGIVQGSTYEALRTESAKKLISLNMDGYAIGGIGVGEPKSDMINITRLCCSILPEHRVRYLMGIGKPEDILEAIGMGVDMFDCVIPTRNGRKGTVYTWKGKILLKNKQYQKDFRPIDDQCECYTCLNFSRAYLRHLFQAEEILGMRLATLHNVHFYLDLMRKARQHIENKDFIEWKKQMNTVYPITESY